MTIRKAVLTDADPIARHLMLAMEAIIYEFIGQRDPEKARAFLLHFVQKENNQYSYQNCFVAEVDHQVIATINIYDGAILEQLRIPIAQYIKTNFGQDFAPEDETQAGEYYIDSFAVHPELQGKNIGAQLLQYVINTYVNQHKKTLGLLVDEANPNAKRLYLKLGFETVGEKILVGKRMLHLQLKPNAMLQ